MVYPPKEGAHHTLSGKLFQQFTRRHENENARALFAHCGLNTLSLPLVWLLIVKLRKLSSMATMERDILYIMVRSNINLLSSSDSAQRVLSLCSYNKWLRPSNLLLIIVCLKTCNHYYAICTDACTFEVCILIN